MTSIVVDNNIMSRYDAPIDPLYIDFFRWIHEEGVLVVSDYLLREYRESNNQNLIVLLAFLDRNSGTERIIRIAKDEIDGYSEDRHFSYRCGGRDIPHARLTFLSPRKKLLSLDNNLVSDVNSFRKVGRPRIKPAANSVLDPAFYR